MRFLMCFLALLTGGLSASAETLAGRSVEITDGRSDTANPAPLIIAMHGFIGTSTSMRKKNRFDVLALKHGLVVAYPNGVRRRWNDGRSSRNRIDDVGYLSTLVSMLVADGRADADRIYFAGHSNGGGMAMRMACDRSDLVKGIAVIATKVPSAYKCKQGDAVPAIFFHGTEDPVAPHAGRPEDSRLGGTLSAVATLELWSARNKCRGLRRTQNVDRRNDGTSAEIRQYARCKAPLTYVLISGHGHAWPGAGPRLPRLQGPATKEVDAAALSWQFFKSL